jgi:NTE family protein
VESLAGIWSALKRSDIFGDFTFRRVAGILFRDTGIASQDALKLLIRRHLPALGEDLLIPTHVTATDYLSGEIRSLSRGSLLENLLASSAIPLVVFLSSWL